jgi:hypothetical protein
LGHPIAPKNNYIEKTHKSAARFTNFIPKTVKLKAVQLRCTQMEDFLIEKFKAVVNPPKYITFD